MAESFEHRPVLVDEVVDAARPALEARTDAIVVDGTAGGGGHAAALLAVAGPEARLIGVDRDPTAVAAATARLSGYGDRVRVLRGSYADVETLAPDVIGRVDVLLVDLGLSSPQLDTPERGFGFRQDGPLDMRFDPSGGMTAADALDELDVSTLAAVLRDHGDVPQAKRVARMLLAARGEGRLETTRDLAAVTERVLGRPRSGKISPATLVFQALRIHVNDELEQLRRLLVAAPRWLRPAGRLLTIAFHSGEDRLVKQAIRFWERGPTFPSNFPAPPWPPVLRALVRKPVEATSEEAAENPRARSARLRVAERTNVTPPPDAAPWQDEGDRRGR